MRYRLISVALAVVLALQTLPIGVLAADLYPGFTETAAQKTDAGDYHVFRHTATGAQVVYLENDAEERNFSITFRTPPEDSKGANHVLEHSLLCGSVTYPLKDFMHILSNSSVAEELNAYTSDDYTTYVIRTSNEAAFYQLSDLYLDSVLDPQLKNEPNIFKKEGIRVEVVDGVARYNGIVYSELKLRNETSAENALDFVSETLYNSLYGTDSPVVRSAGGVVPDLFDLTYDDLMRVYNTYYIPSNMLIFTDGKQNVGKTLSQVNSRLSNAEKRPAPTPRFDPPAAREQGEIYREYNIAADTATVDVGFLTAGPAVTDARGCAAWSVLTGYLQGQMQKALPDAVCYTVGGEAGGVYNMGLIISGLPAEERQSAVALFQGELAQAAENGIPKEEAGKQLSQYLEYSAAPREQVAAGFTYGSDPLALVKAADQVQSLFTDPAPCQKLAAQWQDSTAQVIVASGPVTAEAAELAPKLTAAQLEQAKKDTAAFEAWISAPDDPEALERLPRLDLAGFTQDPFTAEQTREVTPAAHWYRTASEEENRVFLSFPIEAKAEDLPAWCLLGELLNECMELQGLSGYASVSPAAQAGDPETLAPQFGLSVSGDQSEALISLLAAPLTDEAGLRELLAKRRQSVADGFKNPYSVEYDYRLRASGQSDRFVAACPLGFTLSSLSYLNFLTDAAAHPENDGALLERLRGLLASALKRGGAGVQYTGADDGYTAAKETLEPWLMGLPEGSGAASCEFLPGTYESVLVTYPDDENSGHVILVGSYDGTEDRGALRVLQAVLPAKYLLPELRDKRGAYGAGCLFTEDGVSFSTAGGVPVDDVVRLFQGAADWLKTLQISDTELNGFIVNAVNEFDQNSLWSRPNGLLLAQEGRTQADFTRERESILSVTQERLRQSAAALQKMIDGAAIVARVTTAAEPGITYPFACKVDMAGTTATPTLNRTLTAADLLRAETRGGMAELLAASLLDQSPAERTDLARFTDVVPGNAQADALAKLFDLGLLNGCGDGSFRPGDPVTESVSRTVLRRLGQSI